MYRTYERIPAKERPELPERGDPNFKVVMRELWDRRQKELKAAMERMADVPTVLEELIKDLSSKKEDERIQALEELAYLLSDIDVARDFYVLKGWGALVGSAADLGNSPSSRALALEAMGTAVRNNSEFYGWADEGTMRAILENLGGDDASLAVKGVYGLGSMIRGNEMGRKKTKLKGVLGKIRKGWSQLDVEYRQELEKLADEALL
ncbi:hypothetical protein TrRE_jg1625 [Triparma retinervis]|uniref:Uncharacterized protein n=1 Tax=Triparma retinervis TaxID=2557542 RepID=A0A9W6Z6U9_9STRA|nr:hypothetical protein TrRE_jg1625 [Triparma retinervis]